MDSHKNKAPYHHNVGILSLETYNTLLLTNKKKAGVARIKFYTLNTMLRSSVFMLIHMEAQRLK